MGGYRSILDTLTSSVQVEKDKPFDRLSAGMKAWNTLGPTRFYDLNGRSRFASDPSIALRAPLLRPDLSVYEPCGYPDHEFLGRW